MAGLALRANKSRLRVAVFAFASLLGSASVGALTAALLVSPAHAQSMLTTAQQTAAQMQIQAAITNINGMMFADDAAKQQAMSAALATVTLNLIATYGNDYVEALTSLVVQVASIPGNGVPTATLGAGLGSAAVQLADSNPLAARAIAQTVADTGNAGITGTFVTSVNNGGGPMVLTQIAQGETVPPCENPSCT